MRIKENVMRLLYFLVVLFISCNDNATKEASTTTTESTNKSIKEEKHDSVEKPSENLTITCYWLILQRDTIVATLREKGNEVSGKLSFDNYQKDGSSGPVHGIWDGDIIKLWYSFDSEGTKTVMEVWYKKQGNSLIRGTGPMAVRGDSSFFTDPATISFKGNQSLQIVDCVKVPSKYK